MIVTAWIFNCIWFGLMFANNKQNFQDPLSGHWWLGMGLNVVPIGLLARRAIHYSLWSCLPSAVGWGGSVPEQLWNEQYHPDGFREISRKRIQENSIFLQPTDCWEEPFLSAASRLSDRATQPDSYGVMKTHSTGCGEHFYYGGPGPLRSSSFRSDPLALVVLFFAIYFVV